MGIPMRRIRPLCSIHAECRCLYRYGLLFLQEAWKHIPLRKPSLTRPNLASSLQQNVDAALQFWLILTK